MKISNYACWCLAIAGSIAFAGAANSQEKSAGDSGHGIVKPADLKWTGIMKGCELAPVSGDPDADGSPFLIRLKCSAGTINTAQWHPTDEHVTVLGGVFMVGMGEKYDATKLTAMGTGAFGSIPKETRHFALSKTSTMLQVHGTGPFKVNWVNPADVQPPAAKPAAKKPAAPKS
jgi:hypothetical protein